MCFDSFGVIESDNRCTGEATARQLLKRNDFASGGGWQQTIALSLCFLTDLSLAMRQYLQPNQVVQIVQLLQDGTFMCASSSGVSPSTVSKAWRRYQEMGHYTRRAGQGQNLTKLPQASRLMVCIFLTRLSETDSMWVA